MRENAKSVVGLGNAVIVAGPPVATKELRAPPPLVPPRRERRAAWRMQVKKSRLPWAFSSLGRLTHRLEPEVKFYVKSAPPSCCDFSGVDACEDAEEKRARKRAKWGKYVNRS
jgi:hypothetical protein